MKNNYTYKLGVNGAIYDITPVNSGDVVFNVSRLEHPFYGYQSDIDNEIILTRASIPADAFQAFYYHAINVQESTLYLYVYENDMLMYSSYFTGSNIAVDNDNGTYTIELTTISDYFKLLSNFDNEIDIIKKFNRNEHSCSVLSALYAGEVQGCYYLTDILDSFGALYIDGYKGLDAPIFQDQNNDVAGSDNRYRSLRMTQSSNLIEAVDNISYEKATVFKLSLRTLINDLASMFNIRIYVKNGYFVVKNLTEIYVENETNNTVIDLTQIAQKHSQNINNYTFKDITTPEREVLGYNTIQYPRFGDANIDYDAVAVADTTSSEVKYSATAIVDLYGVYLDPDSFSKTSYAIIQCEAGTNEAYETTLNDADVFNSTYGSGAGDFIIDNDNVSGNIVISFYPELENRMRSSWMPPNGSVAYATSDNTFAVTSGDTLTFSCKMLEDYRLYLMSDYDQTDALFYGSTFSDVYEGADTVKVFRVSVFITDADSIQAGSDVTPYSNAVVLDNMHRQNNEDGVFYGYAANKTLTANATISNAVLCFKVHCGYFGTSPFYSNTPKLKWHANYLRIYDITTFLKQNVTLANYDLRPANLLRTFYQSGRYFENGIISGNSPEDYGDFTALHVMKSRLSGDMRYPMPEFNDFDFSGFIRCLLGDDGEFETATYSTRTQMLNFQAVFDKKIKGGTDILRFSFDEMEGSAIIDFNNHTISCDVVNGTVTSLLTNVVISSSYGATVYGLEEDYGTYDFSTPVILTVVNGNNSQDWIVTVNKSYDLKLYPYSSFTENEDVVILDTTSLSNECQYSIVNNIQRDQYNGYYRITNDELYLSGNENYFPEGTFAFFNITDIHLVKDILAYVNQPNIDMTRLTGIENVRIYDEKVNGIYSLGIITLHEDVTIDNLYLNVSSLFSEININDVADSTNLYIDGYGDSNLNTAFVNFFLRRMREVGAEGISIRIRHNDPATHGLIASTSVTYSDVCDDIGDVFEIEDGRGVQVKSTVIDGSGYVTNTKVYAVGRDVYTQGSKIRHMQFDGSTNYLDADFHYNPLTNTQPIEVLVKMDDSQGRIFAQYDGSTATRVSLANLNLGGGDMVLIYTVGNEVVEYTYTYEEGRWMKIAIAGLSLYVDDKLIGTATGSSYTDNSNLNLVIGRYGDVSSFYLNHIMAYFKYLNKVVYGGFGTSAVKWEGNYIGNIAVGVHPAIVDALFYSADTGKTISIEGATDCSLMIEENNADIALYFT